MSNITIEMQNSVLEKIDFIINNSAYAVDYLKSIDFVEFYKIIHLVEKRLKDRAKQI